MAQQQIEASDGTFVQTEFQIGTFWDPCLSAFPDKSNIPRVNRDIARFQIASMAYFNLLTGAQDEGCGISGWQGLEYALHIASKVGLRYLIGDPRLWSPFDLQSGLSLISDVRALPELEQRSILGYHLGDEPDLANAERLKDWIQFFKEHDGKHLAYTNLLPMLSGQSTTDYEAYLEAFLNDQSESRRPSVVSFDRYPFYADGGVDQHYFYNLEIARIMAAGRPFWTYVMSVHHGNPSAVEYINPTEEHLRFMAMAPIVYGAKGLIYFTYELPNATKADGTREDGFKYFSAIVDHCDVLTDKYMQVRTINWFITNVAGPIAMRTTCDVVLHQSTFPTHEQFPQEQILGGDPDALVLSLGHQNAMVGILRDQVGGADQFLLIMNKGVGHNSITLKVRLRGDWTGNKASLSPSIRNYDGSTAYIGIDSTYLTSEDVTTFKLSLFGGEARIVKLTEPLGLILYGLDSERFAVKWASVNLGKGADALSWLGADVDADGRSELLQPWANDTKLGLNVYGWDGSQMVVKWASADLGEGPNALAWLVADVDGDGKTELLQPWANDGRLGLIVYGWDGSKMVVKWASADLGEGPNALAWLVADVDGDGKTELLQPWANGGRLGLIVYGWDVSQMVVKWASADLDEGPAALAWLVADVDGDGKTELLQLWANGDRLGLIAYGWDGSQMVVKWASADLGEGPAALAWLVADVDGDGKTELLQPWANDGRLGLIVYGWDGSKMVVKWASADLGEGPNALAWLVADVDGDGKTELLQPWANDGRLGLIVYSWDGSQMVVKWASADLGEGPNALAWLVADVDGDGKTELLQPWR